MLRGQEVAHDLGRSLFSRSFEAFGPILLLLAEGLSSPRFGDLGSRLGARSSLPRRSNNRADLGRWWDVIHIFSKGHGDFRTKGAEGRGEVLQVWKMPRLHLQALSQTASLPCAVCSLF